jgi:hypothetical protein
MKPHCSEECSVAKNSDGTQQSRRATTHIGRPAGICPSFQKATPRPPEHGSCAASPPSAVVQIATLMRQLTAQLSHQKQTQLLGQL